MVASINIIDAFHMRFSHSCSYQCWAGTIKNVKIGQGFKLVFSLKPFSITLSDAFYETQLQGFM